jgi:uridine monophosphate synthetase
LWDNGLGLIVNVSRSVCQAADPRQAALEMRDRINRKRAELMGRSETGRGPEWTEREDIALSLFRIGAVRFGQFTLKSGQISPIYIDLRLLASYPHVLAQVARAYARKLESLHYDRLAAIPYAALPIGTAVALLTQRPLIYPRKEAKAYGTGRTIEGVFVAGERVAVLDDLITTGSSKLEAAAPLQDAGLIVEDFVVLIDRQGSGAAELAQAGYRLHAVLKLTELLDILVAHGEIETAQRATVLDWLAGGASS